jgi:spore coat protein CotF
MPLNTTSKNSRTTSSAAAARTNAGAVRNGTTRPAPRAATTNKTGGRSNSEFAQEMTALDDVAIISDILANQKALVTRYTVALTESSCDKMRKLLTSHLTECGCDQFDSFRYMNERNQYPTEAAPAQKVAQAKQKYAQKKERMKK